MYLAKQALQTLQTSHKSMSSEYKKISNEYKEFQSQHNGCANVLKIVQMDKKQLTRDIDRIAELKTDVEQLYQVRI